MILPSQPNVPLRGGANVPLHGYRGGANVPLLGYRGVLMFLL